MFFYARKRWFRMNKHSSLPHTFVNSMSLTLTHPTPVWHHLQAAKFDYILVSCTTLKFVAKITIPQSMVRGFVCKIESDPSKFKDRYQGFRYWLAPSRIAAPLCLPSFEDAIPYCFCGIHLVIFQWNYKVLIYKLDIIEMWLYVYNFILIGRSPGSYLVLYCIHTFLTNS